MMNDNDEIIDEIINEENEKDITSMITDDVENVDDAENNLEELEEDKSLEELENQEEIFQEKKIPRDDIEWYVIHTYSGYENKVKANIEKIIENRNMYDVIEEVVVPMQDTVEVNKAGQKKVVARKVFPGYVFLKMVMNDETWYVVRNTRGVTSFVGPGSKPVPLTEDEIFNMGIENFVDTCDMEIGDVVLVKDGPFAKSSGVVQKINMNKRSVIVNVNFFGRETPVELEFHQVQHLD